MTEELELYDINVTSTEDNKFKLEIGVSEFLMSVANRFKAGFEYNIDWKWGSYGSSKIETKRTAVKKVALRATQRGYEVAVYLFTKQCDETRKFEVTTDDVGVIETLIESWSKEVKALMDVHNLVSQRKVKAIIEEVST